LIMTSRAQSIVQGVSDLVEGILEEMGFELVEVEYIHNLGRWILRLVIDKEGGVTIDDCAKVSNELGDLIDVKNFIDHSYALEISSPGLDRPLKKEKDVLKAMNKKIKLKMLTPVEGRRNYSGYLRDFENGMLHVEIETGLVALPWSEVDKANLIYEFKP
jgi:ribosome maturation factor RimP